MSNIINVAIVLIAVFIGLAVACSWIQEQIAWITQQRGRKLYAGILNLVARHTELAQGIWNSSLVKAGTGKPSYVEARNFSLSLWQNVHAVLGDAAGKTAALEVKAPAEALNALIQRVQAFTPGADKAAVALKPALVSLLTAAENDYDKLLVVTDQWFDAQMDRVAGWYKRWAQWCLIGIAIVVGLMTGVDTLDLGKQLYTSSATQAAADDIRGVVLRHQNDTNTSATSPAATDIAATLDKELKGKLNLHIFHPHLNPLDPILNAINEPAVNADTSKTAAATKPTTKPVPKTTPKTAANSGSKNAQPRTPTTTTTTNAPVAESYAEPSPRWHLVGLLITIIAVSLGAPFWFDLLKCLINVRMAGQRPDDVPAPTKKSSAGPTVVVNQAPAAPPAPPPPGPPPPPAGAVEVPGHT